MSQQVLLARREFTVARVERDPLIELHFFRTVDSVPLSLALPPGGLQRRPTGEELALHFAPRKYLIIGDSPEAKWLIDAAVQQGWCAAIDVTGKYECLPFTGARTPYYLANCIDIARVLRNRDCAAVTLFDCPGLLSKTAGEVTFWVHSSYRRSLVHCLEKIPDSPDALFRYAL